MQASSFTQEWLRPVWPSVPGVQAVFTTRHGGVSRAPWDSMNLGDHVRDDAHAVAANRQRLQQAIATEAGADCSTVFLQQVHACDVLSLDATTPHGLAFDACTTRQPRVACTVMVADCLPVLWAHRSGAVVAASHAGWRGLAGTAGRGVLEATCDALRAELAAAGGAYAVHELQVWLGPCIGPQAFEVGSEVREAFVMADAAAAACFQPASHAGKWLADLAQLARLRLQRIGLTQIYGNDGSAAWCTVRNPSQFFSHRRDAAVLGTTGRMAACIWRC